MGKRNNDHRNGQKVNINSDAKEFAKMDFKKFKKKEGEYYDSKKEIKKAYYSQLIDLLPHTIEFVIYEGYKENKETKETKDKIFEKFSLDEKFIAYLTKLIKKEEEEIENIRLLPVVIHEIIRAIEKQNVIIRENDPNAEIYDISDLVELIQIINKKKIKKFMSANIDEKLAFDLLCVLPTDKLLRKSGSYRVRVICSILREHSKTTTIDFETLMKILVDEEYYSMFIAFILLTRRDEYGKLTDQQKLLYNQMTEWAFKQLENSSKSEIYEVLSRYIAARKKDQKDSDRRYDFTLLSESDFPRIVKVVNKMIETSADNKRYLS